MTEKPEDPWRLRGVRVVRAGELDANTAQTPGMDRRAAITQGRAGATLAPMAELFDLGVRVFTDDGAGVQDSRVMRRALEYAGALRAPDGTRAVLAQHCEDAALFQAMVPLFTSSRCK